MMNQTPAQTLPPPADGLDLDNPHVQKMQKELNAGSMALVLLAINARATTPLYGYQIARQLESAGAEATGNKQSALYPVLRNLSANGLLDSWVEPSVSGPPRRYYKITVEGRTVLAQWQGLWQRLKHFVDAALVPSETQEGGLS